MSSESRTLRETFIVGVDFYARWTQLMKFWIWNCVTTVPFGRPTSVRHSLFAILSDHFFWNSCIYSYSEKLQQFRKVLWVVLSSLFLKEIWKNGRKRHGRMFASAKGKRQKGKRKMLNSITFYTGRPYPEVQPLHLLYIPFLTERVPLSYTFNWKTVPLWHTKYSWTSTKRPPI